TAARFENAGSTLNTADGTIDIVGANTLTIAGGTTVIGTNTVLTDNAAATIAFTGTAILALESDSGILATDPMITFGGVSDVITVTSADATPKTFGVGSGVTLDLTNDVFDATVAVDVFGTLSAAGTANAVGGLLTVGAGGKVNVH